MTPPAIDAGITQLEVGPTAATVDARWLMAYSAALGESDARYYDTTTPLGPLPHPLFPVCYEWPLALALRAKAIDDAIAPLGVHATHRLVVHRLPRSGDSLRTSARVTGVYRHRRGALVVIRFTTMDRTGVLVSTTDYGSLYRGVEVTGAAAPPSTVPAAAPGDVRWEERVEVPAHIAHVYSECARIWNPIHTDLAVARGAGLPGPILHGTATLALAVSRVVRRELRGDPAGVRGIAVRFTGMVEMPCTLTVRGRGTAAGGTAFDAVRDDGTVVLAAGTVTL